jgi:hypothetical protein
MGIAAMILGILSLLFFMLPPFALVFALVALILGGVSVRNPKGRGFAIAALATGGAGLLIAILFGLVFFLIFRAAYSATQTALVQAQTQAQIQMNADLAQSDFSREDANVVAHLTAVERHVMAFEYEWERWPKSLAELSEHIGEEDLAVVPGIDQDSPHFIYVLPSGEVATPMLVAHPQLSGSGKSLVVLSDARHVYLHGDAAYDAWHLAEDLSVTGGATWNDWISLHAELEAGMTP